ncbi:MAG: cell filamentation protein Fic [Candidatus Nealsonbacteria bacterium CG_4_8_14_3_um_filter_39_7]|uniref:Cell filamentation protein Fic n=1 Tax=Candidatus Nealsonbacteria bacterium CG23_combo_of_CG06-09_8_20_14_all_39_17 TaxID=1974722 RepID=A0A2G9YUX0_9BACT|nr:MAG: cell filamentation protein Fic [Candidatus Nealsonbacteria bacterium CG23_combo_of_CG06-09_8_20_14_all_39_17]PIU44047.1 MAG: cell filamentation protein Fic [Candidatus Nealsonbacteria bacterium CG07_land_8_20_14_0_80_39_13]PIW90930.1 MAG: cell filamentation protein Fic [Candidatus Nealsonbacteria bacterium CG_4_8_14_3_um_filter_39_7]
MKPLELGKFISQPQGFKAFTPNPFPPKGGFDFDPKILKKNDEATRLLGKLDGITKLLPDADFFLLMYLRKDAASSSQIEGTMATMIDAIEAEAKIIENVPEDVDDILHYIKALNYGIKRMKGDNFPLALRFIKELHKELLDKARSTHFSDPGEFRKSQNWIGGTRPDNARFVPPPVEDMNRAISDLENFINKEDTVPVAIKAGLIHAQFETIHPFLDGNGRTGRMLITFYLWKEGFLEKPVLFLSAYFKKHQKIYYEKLFAYHNGGVEDWIDFFLDGVIEIANEAINIVGKITYLRQNDMGKVHTLGKRASESAMIVIPKLYAQPIVNNAIIQKWTGFTRAGAQRVIDRFIDIGILIPKDKNVTYGQSYVYKKYLDMFTVE